MGFEGFTITCVFCRKHRRLIRDLTSSKHRVIVRRICVFISLYFSSSDSPSPNPSGCSESDAIYVSGKYVINVAYVHADYLVLAGS
jgi:hypothetical protein